MNGFIHKRCVDHVSGFISVNTGIKTDSSLLISYCHSLNDVASSGKFPISMKLKKNKSNQPFFHVYKATSKTIYLTTNEAIKETSLDENVNQ